MDNNWNIYNAITSHIAVCNATVGSAALAFNAGVAL